jgi:hypothetical protein
MVRPVAARAQFGATGSAFCACAESGIELQFSASDEADTPPVHAASPWFDMTRQGGGESEFDSNILSLYITDSKSW